jgi:hypothetical protein
VLAGTSVQQRVPTTMLTYAFAVIVAATGVWLIWP